MFKLITALTALVYISSSISTGANASKDSEATIISNTFTDDGAGNFAFQYETSNAIKGEAKGNLKTITNADGNDGQGEVQQGSYSYVGDDGKTYQLKWVADENGEFDTSFASKLEKIRLTYCCRAVLVP